MRAAVLVIASAAAALAGCAEALPPATTQVATPPALRPGEARVTFVRPSSPCDTGEYAIIVDSDGRFVADVSSGTRVAVATSPGFHVYYAWSNVNVINARDPDALSGVTAVRVQAEASEESFVLVDSPSCGSHFLPALSVIRDTTSWRRELKGDLEDTKLVENDPIAGQRTLDSRPRRLRSFLRLGRLALTKQELGFHGREDHDGENQEDGFND